MKITTELLTEVEITDKMRLDFILDGKDAIIHGEFNIPEAQGGYMYIENREDIDAAIRATKKGDKK